MEALILYFVLFFPGIFRSSLPGPAETIPFSILGELGRILTYTIPSFALLWYIISDKNGFSALRKEKPGKGDLLSFIIGLPGLILIGLAVSLLVQVFASFAGFNIPPKIEAPGTFAGWIIIFFSCLGTGYLEESYFRYYLLTSGIIGFRPEYYFSVVVMRITFSTVLFSLCHMYEGYWGILNAALAGVLLSVLFTRYRSFHGIAWAHGAYNFFVYFMGRFNEVS